MSTQLIAAASSGVTSAVTPGYGGIGGATPAEDLVRAVDRLNAALRAAKAAGWTVAITTGEQKPPFVGEGPIVPFLKATITREV